MLLTVLTTMTACRAGKVIEDTGDRSFRWMRTPMGTPQTRTAMTRIRERTGATEVCDGVDNDCDAEIDEDVLDTFFADADEDGYGDPITIEACDPPLGMR